MKKVIFISIILVSLFFLLGPEVIHTDFQPQEILDAVDSDVIIIFNSGGWGDTPLKEAEDFGREMVERSKKISQGKDNLIPRFPRGSEYEEIYQPAPGPSREILRNFSKTLARIEFKVNKEKCRYPKCTLCIDNCPMESIDFTESPPLFNINCDQCWTCEQACPQGAIEVDWVPFHEAHLPMIPPLEESLKIFEERGTFRRLIPKEDIGWDSFVWQSKHPRFKVVK